MYRCASLLLFSLTACACSSAATPVSAPAAPAPQPAAEPAPVAAAPATAPTPPEGMVCVPGGTFQMGRDDGTPDERPPHEVTLSPYFIDRTEVVNAAYARCADAGRCNPPVISSDEGPLCDWRSPERQRLPTVCLSWQQASEYCAFVEGRLPTEAEWEFAARGTDGRPYPWGTEDPDETRVDLRPLPPASLAVDFPERWEREMEDNTTRPPGSFSANVSPFGLVDMAGNVAEMVNDRFGPYSSEPELDPRGPDVGTERVVRGGVGRARSFEQLRSTSRGHAPESSTSPVVGFRCARAAS